MARVLVDSEVDEIIVLCKETIQGLGRFSVDPHRHAVNTIDDSARRAQRILDIVEGRPEGQESIGGKLVGRG